MADQEPATGFEPYAEEDQPRRVYDLYPRTKTRNPTAPLNDYPLTPSEIAGPRFDAGLLKPGENDLSAAKPGGPRAMGQYVYLTGRVLGEDGRPAPGVMIEIWQANASGRYHHPSDHHDAPLDPNFIGIGRAVTDGDGRYHFLTIKPGAYPMPGPVWRTPHIHFSLFGGSYMNRLITQTYFPGEPLNQSDPILNGIADGEVQQRLFMTPAEIAEMPESALGYTFDFVLRGLGETPFEGR